MRLTIIVMGRPAPQGSHDLGSAGQFRDSSVYLAAWRAAVKKATFQAYADAGIRPEQLPLFPAGSPVHIERMMFFVAKDQCRADGTERPVGTPDIDKLLRATLDALGGAKRPGETARLFADDSQVVRISSLSKERAGDRPGVVITVSDGRD